LDTRLWRLPVITPRRAAGVHRKGRGFGKHGAAFPVQVAGQCIEHIDQPAIDSAKALGAGANAAIDHGARCLGQFAGNGALRCRIDTAAWRHAFRTEGLHRFAQRIQARKMRLQVAQAHPVFCKQGVHQSK
jgi:hypothetical protein